MSMDRCVKCSRAVDTDKDTDCYVCIGQIEFSTPWNVCICEPCRDRIEAELQAQYAGKK